MNFVSVVFLPFSTKKVFLGKIPNCMKGFLLGIFLINILNAAQHNFYIGVNVGMTGFSAKTNNEVSNDQPALQRLHTDKSIRSKSVLGGFYIGYILRLQNFGMGTEVSWQYTNLEKTLDGKFFDLGANDNLYFVVKNKLTSQVEFVLKPGYFIYDYFTYAILGFNLQNMRCDYSAAGETAGEIKNFSDKKSRYVRGYTFGAGFQKNVYETIALGLEFKFSKFPERNYKFDLPHNPGDSEITLSSKVKDIQTYSCSLRFMYTF